MATQQGASNISNQADTAPRLTYTQAVVEAIRKEMQLDKSVIYMGQDVGVFGGVMQGSHGLHAEFGSDRVIETPISESSMAGLGVGSSLFGIKPIVEISFGEFLPSAMNQLINQTPNIHYMTGGALNPALVIRTRVGDGPYGGHPQDYSVWFCHIPGLKVYMPATPVQAYQMMRHAIQDPNPVLFVEPMSLSHGRRQEVALDYVPETLPAASIEKEGKDLTLVSYGSQLPLALRAAAKAEKEGISVEIVNLSMLTSWDLQMVIESVRKTGALLTVHESWKNFGHGAEVVAAVTEVLSLEGIAPKVKRIGAKPVPIPSGPLRKYALPDENEIYTTVMSFAS